MLFLSVFGLLLSKLSGRNDLVVGAPVAGRGTPELQNMCGPFINTLPLRLMPAPDMRVGAYRQAVQNASRG
jgi:non-ribosomal peptide synthetase component F